MGSITVLAPGAQNPQIAKPWNTLERLQWNLYFLLAFDALFLIALLGASHVHRQAMQTIGRDSAPSIIAAQYLKGSIAAMDADAANELLVKAGQGQAFQADYVRSRIEAAKGLIAAAENITYGDSERIPIEKLQIGLGEYEAKLQHALDLHDRNDPAALDAYRQAALIVDDTLLPAADALDQANLSVMDSTYGVATSRNSVVRLSAMVAGFLLLAALVYVQGYISEKTRRTLNVPLVLATLVAFGYLAFAYRALTAEAHSLKVAKEDAFSSIHSLWQAGSAAYVARADLSRLLLGGPDTDSDRKAFMEQAGRVAALPTGKTFAQVASESTDNHGVDGFNGYLADELRNITFYGELESAQQTLRNWGETVTADAKVLQLQQAGHLADAVELCTGSQPEQANGAFHHFDTSLRETLDINKRAFDEAVSQGFGALAGFELSASIVSAIIAALCILGIWQRVREYL
ncbi:MAG TPA: hypothetical protein VH325_13240 [Bryobacteraceae bacterium]|jgi:hypothetical protein|nr:hypothetical protein [Bryobacteraceae bacterium]